MQRARLIILGDFIAFWATLLTILYIRFGESSFRLALKAHLAPFTILYLSWALTFYLFGLYDVLNVKPTIPYFKRFGSALIISFIIGIFFFYFAPIFGISPKTNLIFQIFGFGLISFLIRREFYTLFSKKITRPVILVGNDKFFSELKQTIEKNPQIGLRIISHEQNLQEAIQKCADLKNLLFILEETSNEIPLDQVSDFYKNKVEVIDIAEAYERYMQKVPVSYINQPWMLKNVNSKENMLYDFVSKTINIIVATIILIITSPFLIICALFVYLYDRGPIFYTQERVGLNGKVFKLYKLRSMILKAEENGAIWSLGKKDNRITPIGRITRKLHIDEIPQMINVIKGDLSLVGPRPERPEFVSKLEGSIPHYCFRHIIRPGFTGWAQIKYRYANTVEDSKEKFEYDLYYIKNRNLFLDFGIILKTIQIIFTH
jgi:exopolysaccharide biosynthesis polyprenyl glycosylphosphotransferase